MNNQNQDTPYESSRVAAEFQTEAEDRWLEFGIVTNCKLTAAYVELISLKRWEGYLAYSGNTAESKSTYYIIAP